MKAFDKRAGLTLEARNALVLMVERDSSNVIVRGHSALGSVCKAVDTDKGQMSATITTPDEDSYGDIVDPLGIDFKRFDTNPVVPWNHNYYDPPVAKCTGHTVTDKGADADMQFALNIPDFTLPQTLVHLYAGKFLNAFSIGFWIKEFEKILKEPDGGGDPQWFGGLHITRSELLEFSPVPIPANANALQHAARGIVQVAKSLGVTSPDSDDEWETILTASGLIGDHPEIVADPDLRSGIHTGGPFDEFEDLDNVLKALEDCQGTFQ